LCLNLESFKEELDKYNIDGGALVEKNENMKEYGDIVFNISTTVKIIAPKSGSVSCLICIKNAISISSIQLSAILAREITNALDIIKREMDLIDWMNGIIQNYSLIQGSGYIIL
jgi:hypothetical protein